MKTYPVWKQVIGGLIAGAVLIFTLNTVLADGAVKYTITKDEAMGPIKRTVEATLEQKVNEETLAKLATEIRDSNKKKFNFTFIGWRVEGEKLDTYWANTTFNPDLKINIIGTPASP